MLAELLTAVVVWAVPPTPAPAPRVHRESCPGLAAYTPCYIGDGAAWNDIYLPNTPSSDPFTYQHELGHAYDRLHLDAGERRRIALVMGWPAWAPEAFADFYAGCRRVIDPLRGLGPYVYGKWRSPIRIAARCRLIARTA